MLAIHLDWADQIEKMRREKEIRQAAIWRLLRRAGIGQQEWPFLLGCWLLCQLGHCLVRMGHRLESLGPRQTHSDRTGTFTASA